MPSKRNVPKQLTFVPGTMCDQRVWHRVWARLGPEVTTDYLPMEEARSREDINVLFDMAAARQLDERLNLVAFSMGGYMALDYLLRAPLRVNALVLVCTSASGLHEAEKRQRLATIEYLQKTRYRGVAEKRLDQMLHPDHRRDQSIRQIMRDMDADLGAEVLLMQMRETSERRNLLPELGKISCPVLIICGDEDPFLTPVQAEEMAKAIPNGRFAVAPVSGHMVPLEQADWLADQLLNFFSQL